MIHLLFVDDEQSVLDGLKRTLRPLRKEWNVAFAAGGKQALDLLSSTAFHGVVTDMRMPGMDGLTLLQHVSKQFPNLLRVVLSGQSEMESIARSAGLTHHYLSKPCPLDILSSTINRAFFLRSSFAEPRFTKLASEFPVNWSSGLLTASCPELVTVLLNQPGLYTSLSSLAQCAGFLRQQMTLDADAVVHALGLGTLRTLLLNGASYPPSESFAARQAVCSIYAQRIARMLFASDGEQHRLAHTAALLLDVGQSILQSHFAARYRAVDGLIAAEHIPRSHAEKIIFGVSHAEFSSYIAAQAGLPDALVEALAFHHQPSACPNPHPALLLAVHIADLLSQEDRSDEMPLDLLYVQSLGQVEDLEEWRKVAVVN